MSTGIYLAAASVDSHATIHSRSCTKSQRRNSPLPWFYPGQPVGVRYRTESCEGRPQWPTAARGKGPYVKDEGGGTQPRSRNKDGTWRAKRSDAGTKKGGGKKK